MGNNSVLKTSRNISPKLKSKTLTINELSIYLKKFIHTKRKLKVERKIEIETKQYKIARKIG